MAYCPNCGKELKPGDRFCRNCGTDTGSAPVPNTPYPADKANMAAENRKGTNNSIIITGILCATAVLLVILVLLFLSVSEKPSGRSDGKQISSETQKASETESSAPAIPETEPEVSTLPETETAAPDTPAALEYDTPLKEWEERETLPFSAETFYIELPGYWAGHYNAESGSNYYHFYNIENADAGYGGSLFSIEMYGKDGEWEYLPSYRFLGEKDGIYYVATFPTDVQFDTNNQEITNLYYEMREDIDTILETFIMK